MELTKKLFAIINIQTAYHTDNGSTIKLSRDNHTEEIVSLVLGDSSRWQPKENVT